MEQCSEQFKINEICRCCLRNIGEMRPLYGFSLNEMLHSVTNLTVSRNDGFPELLCFQCVLQLSRAYRFKELCMKSHKTILDFIKEGKTEKYTHENARIENTLRILNESGINQDSHSNDNSVSPYNQHLNKQDLVVCDKGEIDNCLEAISDENKITYKCSICSKPFNSRKQWTRHMKTHNNNKPHKCSECNKTFSEKCNLNKHFYKHSGESRKIINKVYLCSICGKKFKYSSSLAKHMKFHTGMNLLHCSHCTKSFAEKSALVIHQRIHTGDRPYACEQCNRKFTQICNLRKHLRSHNTETLFACSICKRNFVDSHYLRVHIQTHNQGKPPL